MRILSNSKSGNDDNTIGVMTCGWKDYYGDRFYRGCGSVLMYDQSDLSKVEKKGLYDETIVFAVLYCIVCGTRHGVKMAMNKVDLLPSNQDWLIARGADNEYQYKNSILARIEQGASY